MIIDFKAIMLFFSAIVNIVLVWYIIQLLKRFLNFQQQLDEFIEKIDEYEDHINNVYNMETFYGDPTISNLLEHSKIISEECENFKIYYLEGDKKIEEEEDIEEDMDYAP